jgi:hypothetical protein
MSRKYTKEELDDMELHTLKEICIEERIRPESIDTYKDKYMLVKLIFQYCGEESDPYIRDWHETKVKNLGRAIKEYGKENKEIKVKTSGNLTLYKDMDSLDEKGNEFQVITKAPIGATSAVLADRDGNIKAIFDISKKIKNEGDEHVYYMTLKSGMMDSSLPTGSYRNFYMIFFIKDFKEATRLYDIVNHGADISVSYIKTDIDETVVLEAEETADELVIDYGTSFTTAGVYAGDRVKLVYFYSDEICEFEKNKENPKPTKLAECRKCGRCALCPSIVAVKSVKESAVNYIYGREAKKRNPTAQNSVFLDTKRWVNTYEELINVTDFNGEKTNVQRSVIIKNFLTYIIKQAEQQNKVKYKNIYFTSPVKQRDLSIKMYKDILYPRYTVKTEDTIDEAMAVVYDSIAERIVKRDPEIYDRQHNVLMIDCGGSTSDMVKCSYEITQGNENKIEIHVEYISGNTNFGGNNLTYLIMQYLKIKLACYYDKQPAPDIHSLLNGEYKDSKKKDGEDAENKKDTKDTENIGNYDMYSIMDEPVLLLRKKIGESDSGEAIYSDDATEIPSGYDRTYAKFDEAYNEASKIIPTAWMKRESNGKLVFENSSNLKDIKGNFYFLWDLAEKIKVKLYSRVEFYEYSLDELRFNKSNYAIYRKYPDGSFKKDTEYPPMRISRYEINFLIAPEIYRLLKKFVQPYYNQNLFIQPRMYSLLKESIEDEKFAEREILTHVSDVIKDYENSKPSQQSIYETLKTYFANEAESLKYISKFVTEYNAYKESQQALFNALEPYLRDKFTSEIETLDSMSALMNEYINNTVSQENSYSSIERYFEKKSEKSSYISELINETGLSGQTTKIDVFREILKEYIPGNKIFEKHWDSHERKLRCINGAIKYYAHGDEGRVGAKLIYDSTKLFYYLQAQEFNSKETKDLIEPGHVLSDIYSYIDRLADSKYIDMGLLNDEQDVERKIRLSYDVNSFTKVEDNAILKQSPYIWSENESYQEDLDRIEEGYVRIFIYHPAGDHWGFRWMAVARLTDAKDGKLYLRYSEESYEPFEKDEWGMDFFNGER